MVNGAQLAYAGQQDYFVAKIAERLSLCPPDVTESLDIYVSPTFPFLFPALKLQLVLVYSKTAAPIEGPLAFGPERSRQWHPAVATDSTDNVHVRQARAVYFLLHPGSDEVLAPGEFTGALGVVPEGSRGTNQYVPRVLAVFRPGRRPMADPRETRHQRIRRAVEADIAAITKFLTTSAASAVAAGWRADWDDFRNWVIPAASQRGW